VCHIVALPFTFKSILRQKKELWKHKYFTMQKYSLQKFFYEKPKSYKLYYNPINNLKFQHKPPCSDLLCPWLWKIWQLPNTGIHYIMSLYVEVVINLKFESLNEEIMFIYNRQHRLLCM